MNPHTDLDQFPTTVDQPDDSDLVNPAAATLNVPSDGTLNRTFYLHKRLLAAIATNWSTQGTSGAVAIDNIRWSPFYGLWWAVGGGNTDLITQSVDYGRSWTSINLGLDGLACTDVEFDGAGNAVITNDVSTTIYKKTNPGSFAHVTGALIGTVHHPQVAFETVHSVWGIFYSNSGAGGGMQFASSPNMTTWTDRSAAVQAAVTGWNVAGTFNPKIGVGNGRFVVARVKASPALGFDTAVTAGNVLTSWAGASVTATTITSVTDITHPIYSADEAMWMIAIYGTVGGSGVTEFWQSTDDGVSWQQTKVLASSGVQVTWLTNIGHLWAGLTIDGYVIYSVDSGVNWYPSGVHVATASNTYQTMRSGGGGLLEHDWGGVTTGSRKSFRIGNLNATALT